MIGIILHEPFGRSGAGLLPLPQRHIALARQRHRLVGRGVGERIAAERGACFVDREDALRCIARKDRLLRLRRDQRLRAPDEFEIERVEFLRDDLVDQVLHPGEHRGEALLRHLLLRLRRGAVHLLRQRLRRDRKRKADDARQPFVEGFYSKGVG